ncbi:hypothetical protein QTI27_35855, partial [Variovorax sp. J31P216]|nr:hypothetical protein [Variovorax sp. J31P216]
MFKTRARTAIEFIDKFDAFMPDCAQANDSLVKTPYPYILERMPPPLAPALSRTAPPASGMSPALVVLTLALLLGIQPVTTDL